MMIKTAFLGLRVMEGYMVANLARVGYDVKAWNRTLRPRIAMPTLKFL
ncbi:MAG: hypothetical protein ACP5D7_09275 [Limnospira sp.]